MKSKKSQTNPEPELSVSDLAFMLANFAGAAAVKFARITWSELGSAARDVKRAIADQNIDLNEPEVEVSIYSGQLAEQRIGIVDLNYGGGGTGPDPFRFVYFVVDGQFIGKAGMVAS
jgi:hypothetical protein